MRRTDEQRVEDAYRSHVELDTAAPSKN